MDATLMATHSHSKITDQAAAATVAEGGRLHVEPKNGSWAVRKNRTVTSTHATRAQAVTAAKSMARNEQSEVLIHAPDGRVKHRLSRSTADEIMMSVWKETATRSTRNPKA